MADQVITQGAIRSIFQPKGCFVEHPVLQCVQIKAMEPKQNEANPVQRYRVVLSDVRNFIQTMLVPTINEIITSGKLRKGSIVRLLKYSPQQVKDKKILIITELEVLDQYGEPDKIGTPEALDFKDLMDEKPQPQPAGISGSNFYGNKPAQPAQQQQTIAHRPGNQGTSTHPHLYPIESLSPYAHKWTIRARCTAKSELIPWHNARGEGKLFNVNLLDDTGEIRGTAFNDTAEKLYNIFEKDVVYYISAPCRVTLAKKQFSKLSNDYELQFERDTEVEKAEDQENAPQVRYNFTKIGDLDAVEKDTIIDTIGVLKEVGEVNTITSKSTQKDHQKRDLTIADDTQTSVKLTIWGAQARSFDVPLDSVIAFKGVKVSDFGGRSLSLQSSGSMTVEPDIDEAHKLRGWYNAVGQNASFSTHQNLAPSAGNAGNDTKLIATVIEDESYLQDTPTYFTLKATVVFIKHNSTIAYPACQTPGCNKKVIDENQGEWWCEKCQVKWPRPEYRYILSVNVADHTGSLWLNAFDEAGRMIVGMSANEAVALKDEDEAKFATVMQEATCKTFSFKVRGKLETYQNEPKPRYQIQNIYTLDYAREANKLAQILKQYEIKDENSLFV
ncbi:replication protein-like protein A 70 kDa DNA-binding subunit [Westerdykella ornata]|uniref:Replication protein A subunit n=1 Tax=Westerdykella ornata TaxID=318751 RepID=A0A6A6J6B5_WESOR|nr:replication protein-like protein A 70 kDa DNA-binding subunit [Westerdykella ornata]KAF2271683.1 replication protein-like protein A 70 kDa DNA-binding subunit [Westerdykella ornata]